MAGRRGSRRSAGCWGSRHDSPRPSASTGLDALATPYGRADRALRRDPLTFSPRCRRHGEHLVAQFDFYPLPAAVADDRLAVGAARGATKDADASLVLVRARQIGRALD